MTENHRVRSSILRPGTTTNVSLLVLNMVFLSQINLTKLFRADYIFEVSPAVIGLYLYFSIIFGILIVLAVIFFFLLRRKNRIYHKLQKRVFIFFVTIGIIGLLLIFFRFEKITYLGSRLMFLVLMTTFVLWGGWIAFYIIFDLPKEKQKLFKKQKFIKYLPRHKGGLPQKVVKGNTKW